MGKRILLFMLTNVLIIVMVSIILSILGVSGYVEDGALNYQSLMIFCLIWGMVGSFISLALSKFMAKWMMGVKIIDPQQPGEFSELVNTVHEIAKRASLPLPEVGIYDSPDVNAFATGPSKSNSLVAVSTGLLQTMQRDEVEGVLAHEIAHIQNGDMVTMTLIQGVVNAFVMFFARIISFTIAQRVDEKMRWMVQIGVTIALEILFSFLAMFITSWFSRQREFRADAGSAKLVGNDKMIAALEALKRMQGKFEAEEEHASLAALKISDNAGGSWLQYLSTHPPLESRIEALKIPIVR